MIQILGLHLFLISFSVVEIVEVGNNDRDRQSQGQYTGNGTKGPNYFAPHPNRSVKKEKVDHILGNLHTSTQAFQVSSNQ